MNQTNKNKWELREIQTPNQGLNSCSCNDSSVFRPHWLLWTSVLLYILLLITLSKYYSCVSEYFCNNYHICKLDKNMNKKRRGIRQRCIVAVIWRSSPSPVDKEQLGRLIIWGHRGDLIAGPTNCQARTLPTRPPEPLHICTVIRIYELLHIFHCWFIWIMATYIMHWSKL